MADYPKLPCSIVIEVTVVQAVTNCRLGTDEVHERCVEERIERLLESMVENLDEMLIHGSTVNRSRSGGGFRRGELNAWGQWQGMRYLETR